ncbi:hypothetical protein A2291_08750 [candidate division WOR-1 bacterium RIFOXYB2_FULL_42_35]|uniref:Trigger factor n=1 Tax=candidate division WOR-1 bacterium RIFOXYC2_FULL_41_25 TaxID=1802586 RepID=A0A1F4TNM8_UNCSA|nr:MAG: hypothetical protein A2291_08750 [candidate division WOR-1 bacterium RIFOXYB2_FULL_42_35]OGC23092.1 MAG: hypothetical protein A2247_08650 [candidate division WOR-1 bacterium RIFOXYA2_FULL_41_14]OGC33663.1 MAG: hypothetical protein A2462_02340 [candidate division WOR-1 bacterium RIFOXYC2_FULL_41_25]
MKIRSQKRKKNTVHLEVEEEYSKFAEAIEKSLLAAGREIKIPGFRQGKAPKDMIRQAINPEYVESRAAQDLIADLYPLVIDETKIEPIDYPNIDIVESKKDQPFVFKISVDVYPEVKLGKYKGLKVEKKSAEIAEEEIDKTLGNFQERFAKTDAEGNREVMPLDDEFAKKVSRFQTLAELRSEIRSAMQNEKKAAVEADVKDKLVAATSDDAELDVPNGMIEREINIMLDELRTTLMRSGLTLDDYLKGVNKEEKAMREEMRKSAEIRVKGKIVLKAVAAEEKMSVSEEEVEVELQSMAAASGEKIEELKKRLDDGVREYIEEYLLRKKALDFLVEKAKITILDEPQGKEEKA